MAVTLRPGHRGLTATVKHVCALPMSPSAATKRAWGKREAGFVGAFDARGVRPGGKGQYGASDGTSALQGLLGVRERAAASAPWSGSLLFGKGTLPTR